MNIHEFDDSKIRWATIEGLDHLAYYVYDVDEQNKIVDILFKFSANKQVMLHRHKAAYITLVIQGELRFYRGNGEFKEVRPAAVMF